MVTADDNPAADDLEVESGIIDPPPAEIGGEESSGASTGTDPLGLGTLDLGAAAEAGGDAAGSGDQS